MAEGEKGSKKNPYTMSEYEELADKGQWKGGYVKDSAGTVSYMMAEIVVNGYSGSGSGSYGSDFQFGSYKSFSGDDMDDDDDEDDDKEDDKDTGEDQEGKEQPSKGGTSGGGGISGGGASGGGTSGGGTDPTKKFKKNCFFNCMEYIGKKYGLSYLSDFYQENYINAKFWERGNRVKLSYKGSPYDYVKVDGEFIPNPDSLAYLNHFFDTRNEGWQEDTKKIDCMLNHNRKENKGIVLGVIRVVGDSNEFVSHAVILYADSGNYYTYRDPSSDEIGVNIRKDEVLYAVKIYGSKK